MYGDTSSIHCPTAHLVYRWAHCSEDGCHSLYCTYVPSIGHTCDQAAPAGPARAARGAEVHTTTHNAPHAPNHLAPPATPMASTMETTHSKKAPPPPPPPLPPKDDTEKFAAPLPPASTVASVSATKATVTLAEAVPRPTKDEKVTSAAPADAAARPKAGVEADAPYDDAENIMPGGVGSGAAWLLGPTEEDAKAPLGELETADVPDGAGVSSLGVESFLSDEEITLGELANVEDEDGQGDIAMSEPVDATTEMEYMESASPFPNTGIDLLLHEINENHHEMKDRAQEAVEECRRKLKAMKGGGLGVVKTIAKKRGASCNASEIEGILASPNWRQFVEQYPVVKELLESYLQVPDVKFNPSNYQYNGGMNKVLRLAGAGCSDMKELARAAAAYEREDGERVASGDKKRECHALRILRKGIGQKLGDAWVVRQGKSWVRMKTPEELPL